MNRPIPKHITYRLNVYKSTERLVTVKEKYLKLWVEQLKRGNGFESNIFHEQTLINHINKPTTVQTPITIFVILYVL